ncbi:UDP-N-acetylmuramate--L-alanine ligase [Cellulomonas soli]|uniref:UDP-N-acetylmuramate--L-alanine ligase n=1 Tax=Cellulomonas soli TaxID=931535 RepID=UPI0018270DD2|nr:UDP-N-acetylmuramate--L-alanine ligase [Cellulomonas soli]NYI60960.1 UDP-N-acetylmuramate--alanine ligase [Cellulomonas soli]
MLLAGGGTAGHVNPLLAVADELRRRDPSVQVTVLGTASGLEARLVPEHGLPLAVVPRVPLPRRPTLDWFRLPGRLQEAVHAADRAIEEYGAQVVVGFGGYVSTPAYLAARRRGVPVVIHEQNARAGLANKLGARWAAEVAVTFGGTGLPGEQVVGLPLRAPIARLLEERATDASGARRSAAAELGLDPDLPTLLVTGGSLGAVSVNTAVSSAASALLAAGVQVLHLTGADKDRAVRARLEGLPGAERYHVLPYLSQMHLGLAVADVVLGRAGAGTVCELAALGIPAVYVPLPIGNGEQRLNAAPVVEAGGGLLVDDAALDAAWVEEHVIGLLVGADAAATRSRMAAAAAGVGVSDAATRVARLVEAHLPPATDDVLALGATHLIGVGGAGMSAIAALLAARGVPTSGSDAHDRPALPGLRAAGVQVFVGHDPAHLGSARTVVVSSAVRESNPELTEARARGLRVLHRSEALAALMADRDSVAVAGAHGKTTTSAMIATALVEEGADPSFAIGGSVLSDEGPLGGSRDGHGPVFVAEADESDGSFLAYRPLVAVVTNVEPDHLDHYGTREAFEEAFTRFARRIRPGGLLVACADDPGAVRLVEQVREPLAAAGTDVVTYGRAADADVVVGDQVADGDRWSVSLTAQDGASVEVRLAVPGAHNALDAAAAWAVLRRLGLSAEEAARGLEAFRGTGRRFEDRGTVGGVRVVDDYAHHPTEVAALLRAARTVADGGRVLALFQPHLYSRTRTFAREFGEAFGLADVVVVTDVYAAREDPDPEVTGALVVDQVPAGTVATFVPDRLGAAAAIAAHARPGDLLLTVGAGDVTELGPVVLELLGATSSSAGASADPGGGPA